VFHTTLPIGSKEVEAQAVSLGINQRQQLSAKGNPERRFEEALEDRELNPLAMILTQLGDLAQATAACLGLRLDVVGYQHHHEGYLQKNDG
jgi:hypothetical protein